MNNMINTLGLAIIASKYAVVLLLAGLSISTGTIASEGLMLMNVGSNE
ncbi:hypothetical protein [Vibrio algarum]|uniref:Uncharacterized protein n=1 Tax=Vibrio algarum TaxID=3020714 RepID=A0ABT4YPN0_9VIBR|nr:hypothetical protein [Vibrio sp. KJ40-1]MDB1123518.1 hypothetical protein [Vibrio sp. KJ40-1]